MTHLYLDTVAMPSAALGPANALPPIQGDASLDKTADLAAASQEIRINAAYGGVASIAPYLMQDNYSRRRTMTAHRVAVLENDRLRATFLLDLGGRLWSLVDRATGRELLYSTPILQPANLALRNAWFAGGVEWNIGTIGHTPLTCAPLHAARVTSSDGDPVLRLWEFERLRRVVYQLDVHLPKGADALFVHVRIANPNDHDVPMYWWSNIAVPQSKDTRVLAPASRTWNYSYDAVLRHDPVAPAIGYDEASGRDESVNGRAAGAAPDISYPARFFDAADFFFDLDDGASPWIAAIDGHGAGLFQASTARLGGRKLFRWGTSAGGRHWQEWLSGPLDDPDGGYAEIQAGLAATQFEHLRMPAREVWAWTEAYGPLEMPAAAAHGSWDEARAVAAASVQAVVSADRLVQVHVDADAVADAAPDEVLHHGSGWGALERRLRRAAGEPPLEMPGTPFGDETLGDEQQPWLILLQTGSIPAPADGAFPESVHLHPLLVDRLASADGWAAPALRGVALAAAGDWDRAEEAWQQSLDRGESAYAHRHLAVAALRADGRDMALAVRHYLRALELSQDGSLVIEALRVLIDAGEGRRALEVIDSAPEGLRRHGRIRLLEARAAMAAGEIERCGEILRDPSLRVADLREGEDSLDTQWWDYHAHRLADERGVAAGPELRAEAEATVPLPEHLDFRMKPGQA